MKKFAFVVLACALSAGAAFAQNSAAPLKGETLVDAKGSRLGSVYAVEADGSVDIISDSRRVKIPANTLSRESNRLTTSLTKKEVGALR